MTRPSKSRKRAADLLLPLSALIAAGLLALVYFWPADSSVQRFIFSWPSSEEGESNRKTGGLPIAKDNIVISDIQQAAETESRPLVVVSDNPVVSTTPTTTSAATTLATPATAPLAATPPVTPLAVPPASPSASKPVSSAVPTPAKPESIISEPSVLKMPSIPVPETKPVVPTAEKTVAETPASDNAVISIFGSFEEIFISSAAIDQAATDLHQDRSATAVFFEPDYSWQAASEPAAETKAYFEAINLNSFLGPYNDKRCLAGNCLEQKGSDLYYNGQAVNLPPGVSGLDIAVIGLGSTDSRFLVGFTIRESGQYRGLAFSFDGANFTALPGVDFTSPYQGVFGFGGSDNDFLAIYGAYSGVAYHIKDGRATDISRFFDLSVVVMRGGFKPEVIRASNGTAVNWYIYSTTAYDSRFIKLWQNGTDDIAGVMVLDNLLSYSNAAFRLVSAENDKFTLLARVKNGDETSWMSFVDRGFKNQSGGTLRFAPIFHNGNHSVMAFKQIARASLGLDAASASQSGGEAVRLYFSENGSDWRELSTTAKNFSFSTAPLASFYLKTTFPPVSNRFFSPFLSNISFDYYLQK